MRRAITADFAAIPAMDVQVLAPLDPRWPEDPGPWKTVSLELRHGLGPLLELAQGCDYTVLIAPETTGTLARLVRSLEERGVRSLGCSSRSIELTGDKLRLAEWFLAHGIPTPDCQRILTCENLPPDTPYPAVLKPVDGAGSVDTYYLERPDTPVPGAHLSSPALLQAYEPGIPMSGSYLVDRDGRAWLVGVGKQLIAVRDGKIEYEGGEIPFPCRQAEPVLRRALEIVPGLLGFVGVDFVWDPRREKVTVLEINPRPTTSWVGLCRLLPPGTLARAWLAACGVCGQPRELLAELSGIVHSQAPIAFDPRGDVANLDPRS